MIKTINDVRFDLWNGDKLTDATKVSCTFYPNDAIYRGNLWKGAEMIGDYETQDSVALEQIYPGIFGK